MIWRKKTQENFESEILPMKGQIEELELELDESKTEVESLSNQRLDLAKNADKDFLKIYERLCSSNKPPIISETNSDLTIFSVSLALLVKASNFKYSSIF